MKHLKKHTAIATVVIILLLILFSHILIAKFLIRTKIDDCNLPISSDKHRVFITEYNLLWDTGDSGTQFYFDIDNKFFIGIALYIDHLNNWLITKRYYSAYFNKDNFTITNFDFEQLDFKQIFDKQINGVIGMNVIRSSNWLIDFQNNMLSVFSQDSVYQLSNAPNIIFGYTNSMRPKISINIHGTEVKDVLIDSGSDCAVKLVESEIERINRLITPVDSVQINSYGSLTNSIKNTKKYKYAELKIGNIVFENVEIVQGEKNMLGIGFFRQFSKIFLDTKKQEFQFYK